MIDATLKWNVFVLGPNECKREWSNNSWAGHGAVLRVVTYRLHTKYIHTYKIHK